MAYRAPVGAKKGQHFAFERFEQSNDSCCLWLPVVFSSVPESEKLSPPDVIFAENQPTGRGRGMGRLNGLWVGGCVVVVG